MENKKKGLNLRAIIPLATAIVSLVFIVVGLKDYGFWKAQPTPGFFPIIIAVVLLVASVVCFFQTVKDKDSADVGYNRNELMVMLGAAAIRALAWVTKRSSASGVTSARYITVRVT